MRKVPLLLLILASVMVGHAAPVGTATKSRPVSAAVTATFRDGFFLTPPDRVGSDGIGAYVNGQNGVKAIIDPLGDFDLDTNTGGHAGRTLFADFGVCAAAPCSPPFAAGEQVDAYLSTGAGGLLSMPVPSSKASKLQILFITPLTPDTQWFLRFDHASYPDTSTVVVTRTATNAWAVEATAPNAIAKLLSATTKGKLVMKDRGNFIVPFQVAVTLK